MGKKSQVNRNVNAKKPENVTEPNRTISTKKRKQLDRLVDDLLKQVVVQTPNNETLWEVYKEVNRILGLIKSLEPPEETLQKDRHDAVDNFKFWIKENGVNCQGTCRFEWFTFKYIFLPLPKISAEVGIREKLQFIV